MSLVIQQAVPHRPDHHRLLPVPGVPDHLELLELSGMNRRLPLMTALAAVLTGFRTRLHRIGLRQIAAGMRYVPPPGAVGSVSKGEGQSSRTG